MYPEEFLSSRSGDYRWRWMCHKCSYAEGQDGQQVKISAWPEARPEYWRHNAGFARLNGLDYPMPAQEGNADITARFPGIIRRG